MIDTLLTFLPFLALVAVLLLALWLVDRLLRRRWADEPDAQFKFQLIMLCLSLAVLVTIISALPVSDALRGQLLSLLGILLSAAIALASTTFIGNIMAGIMLKAIRKARPGDFITVEELTGRITEMDLLHTEIQTEFRDLVTVPNSYMVSNPLKVVRSSGSIITAEISLGYDVPHTTVSQLLRAAAEKSGLRDGFVHIRQLGDFAITYRVAGMLEDIHSLISARSRLQEEMLDALHGAGIEIVSPTHMATRSLAADERILPPAQQRKRTQARQKVQAEALAFDKAEDAANAEKLRAAITAIDEEIESLAENKGEHRDEIDAAANRRERLVALLRAAEADVKAGD